MSANIRKRHYNSSKNGVFYNELWENQALLTSRPPSVVKVLDGNLFTTI
jgi:hypothetical protein